METFIEKIQESLQADSFVKLTLGKPSKTNQDTTNVYVKAIFIQNTLHLSFTYRYPTKDEVKNYLTKEALMILKNLLEQDFMTAVLFTTDATFNLQISRKGKVHLSTTKPTLTKQPAKTHDKQKKRLISPENNIYLKELGITSSQGKVVKSGQKKYKQINKYIEIIDSLLNTKKLNAQPHIVDMGSGKGYLTFALYDYLQQQEYQPTITGIELRTQLVEDCNKLAQKAQFDQLLFLASDIFDYHPERIDMLIALHACDIATDIAIAKGIKAQADIIVVAPCCHKQVRKAMKIATNFQPILKHGILMERQAELLTDGIRALILEYFGYKTKVFEFISTEHTAKNLMIVGTKSNTKNLNALEQVRQLKQTYGVETHYLETLVFD